jgi:4-alpha-glucanotransferase
MDLSLDQKIAAVLAPLFAIRGKGDQGIGDTSSLMEFLEWAADAGFRVVQLLPINEMGGDHSPYNAISSRALDPLTIRLTPEVLPDLAQGEFESILQKHPDVLRNSARVDYAAVHSLKKDLVGAAFANFERTELRQESPRARCFHQFIDEHREWLPDYVLFRVLQDANGGSAQWPDWPEHQRNPESARQWIRALEPGQAADMERGMTFYRYVQWLAFTQWRKVKEKADAVGVALMGDIPFGVSRNSVDVWRRPDLFILDWCGGTPPDPVFKYDPFVQKWGQNWGIPLYNWAAMEKEQLCWWRSRVHGVREFFHLFRIDHVLGFYRIYAFPWLPEEDAAYLPLDKAAARARTNGRLPEFYPRPDDTDENQDLNRREGEQRLIAIQDGAGKGKVNGEDLGIVPEYVRPSLTSLGIAGYKVPQWEQKEDGRFKEGRDYPRLSIATYATHDHAPLRKQWDEMKARAPKDASVAEELRHWCEFAHLPADAPPPFSEAGPELLRVLLRSNAWLVSILITDVLAEAFRFNAPGTEGEGNWTQRLPFTVEELFTVDAANRVRDMIASEGRSVEEAPKPHAATHDEIASRAYFLSLERAQQGLSPDPAEDWSRAQHELSGAGL